MSAFHQFSKLELNRINRYCRNSKRKLSRSQNGRLRRKDDAKEFKSSMARFGKESAN